MTAPAHLEALRRALSSNAPKRYDVGKRAAVLVPFHPGPDGLQLLFMKRPDDSRAHPGQVSFPGGGIEVSDVSEHAAALREANEELGVIPADVRIVGQLDDVVTGTGYTVTPVVGVLERMPALQPNPKEVADWFWFPFSRFFDGGWRGMDITREGQLYRVWFYDGAPHTIWGATAAMVRQMVDLVEGA